MGDSDLLDPKDMKKYEQIFKKLDKHKTGRVDIHDLRDELGMSEKYAKQFIAKSDSDSSGDVSLKEFVNYLQDQEKNLRLQFSRLDRNHDGVVELDEMITAFKELGVNIDYHEAVKLFNRMDKDGSLDISYNEWRSFLLLAPSTDIHDIVKYWRHSTYLDIGEDFTVPDDFTESELKSGIWWRQLVAGAVAGGVSRTFTAPADRLRVMLQVYHSKQKMTECFSYMLKEGGVKSLWRGNGLNVVKIAPESALKFMVYEQVKRFIRGDSNRPLTIYERFVSGAVAGCVSQSAIYPMEVLKTRLAIRKTGQYSGVFDAAKKIYANEGIRVFYRGYIPNLLGIIPYAGIDLAVYETLKRHYISSTNGQEIPQFWVPLACGSTSSTIAQVVSYPLALVRTKLQAMKIKTADVSLNAAGIAIAHSPTKEHTMTSLFKKIIREEGVPGLYRGITPNFIKVLPAVSISYITYELVSQKLGINMA